MPMIAQSASQAISFSTKYSPATEIPVRMEPLAMTSRPPRRAMVRPTRGAIRPPAANEIEMPATTITADQPVSAAMKLFKTPIA